MTENNSENLVNQAMQLISTQQFDQAENLLNQAGETDPENGGISCMQAYVAHKQGQPEQSLVLIRKALAQGIKQPNHRLYLAQLYHETGQLENAAAIIEDIIAANPGNAPLLARLANVLQDTQNLNAFQETLLKVQNCDKLNPAVVLYTLANLLFSYWQQGNLTQCAAYGQLMSELRQKAAPENLGQQHISDSDLGIAILQYLSDHNHEYQHGIDDNYTAAMIGDRNVLAMSHIPVNFGDHSYVLKPKWIRGVSLTALASPSANNIKASFSAALGQVEAGHRLVVACGYEDCQPSSQLFARLLEGAAPLEESCQALVQGYLDFVQQQARDFAGKITIVGIQAPCKDASLGENVQAQQLAMVQTFNKYLTAETTKRGLGFADLYKVTADPNGGYALEDSLLSGNYLKPASYKSALDEDAAN